MGSPHQWFVIARLGRNYRLLVSAECRHCDDKAEVVRRCATLLQNLNANRHGIYYDLREANRKYSTNAVSTAFASEFSPFNVEQVAHPHLATYLISSVSSRSFTSRGVELIQSNSHLEDYENATGVTFVDVTDVESIRYGIVFPFGKDAKRIIDIATYCGISFHETQVKHLQMISKFNLVTAQALNDAFSFSSRETTRRKPKKEPEFTSMETSPAQTTDSRPKNFETISTVMDTLSRGDVDCDWSQVPNFKEALVSKMRKEPQSFRRLSAIQALTKAVQTNDAIDFSPFVVSFDHLLQMAKNIKENHSARQIFLPQVDGLTFEQLKEVIGLLPNINIHIGHTDLHVDQLFKLKSTTGAIFTFPALYRFPLVSAGEAPCYRSTPPVALPANPNPLPLTQALFIIRDFSEREPRTWPKLDAKMLSPCANKTLVMLFPLQDAAFPLERTAILPRLIATLGTAEIIPRCRDGLLALMREFAERLACEDVQTVLPLLPLLNKYKWPDEKRIGPMLAGLKCGEWTMVAVDAVQRRDARSMQRRYFFATLSQDGKPQFVDVNDFVHGVLSSKTRAGSENFEQAWKSALNEQQFEAYTAPQALSIWTWLGDFNEINNIDRLDERYR